ncbi:putative glycerol-3-phosphate transporter 5 [Panicum miliaceum]|uniref:Glycerol-3-phosphate transporter 5 n=1 Tax=Panicum miliaceum TaxID=4540 RepID=A0A3L6TT12_PANMI|nr:putative glycerol-3-phosphate transporter 5 [Panicum miliaceum]
MPSSRRSSQHGRAEAVRLCLCLPPRQFVRDSAPCAGAQSLPVLAPHPDGNHKTAPAPSVVGRPAIFAAAWRLLHGGRRFQAGSGGTRAPPLAHGVALPPSGLPAVVLRPAGPGLRFQAGSGGGGTRRRGGPREGGGEGAAAPTAVVARAARRRSRSRGRGVAAGLLRGGYFLDVHALAFFAAAQVASGVVQSAGWPCVVAIMGNWFGFGHAAKRGTIMEVWNSHTSVGNIAGSVLAAAVLEFAFIIAALGVVVLVFLVAHPARTALAVAASGSRLPAGGRARRMMGPAPRGLDSGGTGLR